MAEFIRVDLLDDRRKAIEDFIRRVYQLRYGAELSDFPATLIALAEPSGRILCAAGLRTSKEGFFSEIYLDHSIEATLSRLSARPVIRGEVLEISSLASVAPVRTLGFLRHIWGLGES